MKYWKKAAALLVVVAVGVAGFGFRGAALAQEMTKDKDVVAELEKVKNKDNPFTIKIWTEGNKDTYKVDEKAGFFFAADRDCYLYIIDVGTSGKAHLLFPNQWQKANKAEKGKVYKLPPEGSQIAFKVKGPAGTNYTKVIASPKPLEALSKEGVKMDGPFTELINPSETVKDMEAELEKTRDWAEAELSVKVVQ